VAAGRSRTYGRRDVEAGGDLLTGGQQRREGIMWGGMEGEEGEWRRALVFIC
jgi:hypothetical protein